MGITTHTAHRDTHVNGRTVTLVLVITLEDGVLDGGFGEKIARYYGATNMKVLNFGAKKEFVDRYDIQEFLRANHLTDEQIVEDITAVIG